MLARKTQLYIRRTAMKTEQLCMENLKEEIFCAIDRSKCNGTYNQLVSRLEEGKLRGQIVRDHETAAGFILYCPIEHTQSNITSKDLYIVECMFVKPEYQNKGFGQALIESALADARKEGASGLAVDNSKNGCNDNFEYIVTMPFIEYKPIKSDFDETNLSESDKNGMFVHENRSYGDTLDISMPSGVFVDGKLTFFKNSVSEEDILYAVEIARQAYDKSTDR